MPTKQHLREVILHYFLAKKSAAETHRHLEEVYGEQCPSISNCKKWFRRFKTGDFDTDDNEHGKPPKKFDDEELIQLIEEDPCQTQEELSAALNTSQQCISKRLEKLGMIRKQCTWIPYELKERDMERRKTICEMLLQRHERKGFLHRVVTGDEKWIHYENPKRKYAWVWPGEAVPSTSKPNIHRSKTMLSVWWDQRGIIYFELLESNEKITGESYRKQLIRLKRALIDKRPEWENRHNKLILLHDNARPHVHSSVVHYLKSTNWEVLPHPPYSPDIAPSFFFFFFFSVIKSRTTSCDPVNETSPSNAISNHLLQLVQISPCALQHILKPPSSWSSPLPLPFHLSE
jgi:[histone H3]-lysine36 N-dimethyltransferase SETMAR